VSNPDFAIITAAYPYVAERLLTDQTQDVLHPRFSFELGVGAMARHLLNRRPGHSTASQPQAVDQARWR